MIDEINDIVPVSYICGAGDAGWFVEGNVDLLGFGFEGFIVNHYFVVVFYSVAFLGDGAIDFYSSGFDEFVRFAARADACAADVFI